eukprot:892021-Prorocentrum_minimum.AAC.1
MGESNVKESNVKESSSGNIYSVTLNRPRYTRKTNRKSTATLIGVLRWKRGAHPPEGVRRGQDRDPRRHGPARGGEEQGTPPVEGARGQHEGRVRRAARRHLPRPNHPKQFEKASEKASKNDL